MYHFMELTEAVNCCCLEIKQAWRVAVIKTHMKMADRGSGCFCASYRSALSLWKTGCITALIQNIIICLLVSNSYTDLFVMMFDFLQSSKSSCERKRGSWVFSIYKEQEQRK